MFNLQGADAHVADVRVQWGLKIELRDGVRLSATLYLPAKQREPVPAIVTLTPYIAQMWHDFGTYFAARGFPFLVVDVRGRGDSEGEFKPNFYEANDGYDVVEWLALQPFCDGRVAMWGGSYAGHAQWATARAKPPHLVTIVPVAAPYMGIDFPMRSNIPTPYLVRWLTLVSGRASQEKIFADQRFWRAQFRRWFESGTPFSQLDSFLGNASPAFQEWVAHPHLDGYWDSYHAPVGSDTEPVIPILTITGMYDGGQLGALAHYRRHMSQAPPSARSRHYLVIGPWDHSGTRIPRERFCGLEVATAAIVDLPALHVQWYTWTMYGGPKPEFLKRNVAYYVMGAERWRYADSLDAVTVRSEPLYLQSDHNPGDIDVAGRLAREPASGGADHYIYDPRDLSLAELESTLDADDRTQMRLLRAASGKHLVYDSARFDREEEITGFFRLSVWIGIDRSDTDIRAAVYYVDADGESVLLTFDAIRARYRESLREATLVRSDEPLLYEFSRFPFVARQLERGARLRVVIGPINSIYSQKNYNSGKVVAEESMSDAKPVRVRVFHDHMHRSVLHVPYGKLTSDTE